MKQRKTTVKLHKKTAAISANQRVSTELHDAAELNLAGIPAVSIKPKKHAARWKWFQNLTSHPNTRREFMRNLNPPDFPVDANF